ncbi:hypothetical protein H5410_032049 [Solanum commersonii]|uniref:EF-hand domain-containing protein n=1 Tax=Solanum commersonii TaxID=4109 RepID=A0A9J5YLR8_SOLCO|nr:hypothetical protein H5410_032049 [Solanum commersonii]
MSTNIFQKPSPVITKLLHEGILNYEADKWAKHRRIINLAFHLDKLRSTSDVNYEEENMPTDGTSPTNNNNEFSSLFRAILFVFNTPFNKPDNAETSSKANVNTEGLLEEDVELVLDTLMNFCNQNGDKNIDEVELVDVFDSFDETVPSLEEVKEAFDENRDGRIEFGEFVKLMEHIFQ